MSDYGPEKSFPTVRRELGRRLRVQRLARGLRQTDLAAASGVGEATTRAAVLGCVWVLFSDYLCAAILL